MKNRLIFSVTEDARHCDWSLPGTALSAPEQSDFWRIMADDGYYMDMTFRSSKQTGSVKTDGGVTVITYDKLTSDTGRTIDAKLTLYITEKEDGITFGADIDNRGSMRLNEFQYPYVSFDQMAAKRQDDVLYRPEGMGERIVNPWSALETAHTEYMSSDNHEIKSCVLYPHHASMAWMGIQSGKYFFYIARQDDRPRACCLLNAISPRGCRKKMLASAICHYPFVKKGEKLSVPPVFVSMFEGDWTNASDLYGSFARKTFFVPHAPCDWVQNMTGWQRVILRHQFGEIFFRYDDLPRLYSEGKKYGLDTLLVFGWWKGRFDNGYPVYETDDELGGEQALKDAISEVKRLGGNVILYNNGILIDKKTDFYKNHHDDAAKIDIDGNEYVHNYRFENDGTVLRNYGYKSFVEACQATDIWYKTMENNARMKLALGADSIFFDQVGGKICLCFNREHKHGDRPDDELFYRRENLKNLRALLGKNQALGTECTSDATAGFVDYIHGCETGNYVRSNKFENTDRLFPALFRRTFPEVIMSNRFVHDCRTHWKDELNFAFVFGNRFDVAIYRCRAGISAIPAYARHLGRLLAIKERYKAFFYDRQAAFVCDDKLTVPKGVVYAEYKNGGTKLFALANGTSKAVRVDVMGQTVTVHAHDVLCVECQ